MMRFKAVSLSICVLLIVAICSGNALESQAQNGAKTGAKSEIAGHWAAPDCANTQEALSFTRSFYLKTAPDRLELGRYRQQATGADHLILALEGTPTAVMRQEDGVLRTGTLAQLAGDKKSEWDALVLDNPRDYANCPASAAFTPKALQRITRYLDRIDSACALAGKKNTDAPPRNLSQDCARVLFKTLDDNADGHVSLMELKLGLVSASLLAALAENTVLDSAGIDSVAATAHALASTFGSQLMQAQDINGDGVLDYNEAVNIADATDLSPLKDIATGLGAMFPAFRLAAFKL